MVTNIFLYILVTYTCIKKYLVCDLSSEQDSDVREYFQEEQTRILQTDKDVVNNMNKKLLIRLPHLDNILTILLDLEAIYQKVSHYYLWF